MTRIVRSRWVALVGIAVIVTALAGVDGISSDAGASPRNNRTVEVTSTYRRVIEPSDPANPPSQPPTILPTITCERRVGRERETVFGYEHRGHLAYDAPPGTQGDALFGANYFRDGARNVVDLGQLTQFLPGSHPSRFAVRTVRRASWVLQVPAMGSEALPIGTLPPRWQVSIKPRRAPCAPDVPQHFAAQRGIAGVDVTPVDVVRDTAGHITGYALQATVRNSATSCSAGGVPIEPRVVFGWADQNLVPLAPNQIIRHDIYDNFPWTRTKVALRQVADVHFLSQASVITDTYGLCQFGTDIVESADPFWDNTDSSPPSVYFFVTVVNGVEELDGGGIGPGGVRFR